MAMDENADKPQVQVIDTSLFSIEVLSVGKQKAHPAVTDDRWVVTDTTFAVIDGASSRVATKFEGKTGGEFAADSIVQVLQNTPPSLNGVALVTQMTTALTNEFERVGLLKIIAETPEARPAAAFISARMDNDSLILTYVGDSGCRINGSTVYQDTLKIDEHHTVIRVKTMQELKAQNPDISDEDLLILGRKAIEDGLKEQTRTLYNNPDSEFGHGVLDGRHVPEKFIRVHEFPLSEIKTLELFSDGYFKLGDEPTITAWEAAFETVEKEDPLKWKTYPAVKGSTPDQFTDDRTILIVRRK